MSGEEVWHNPALTDEQIDDLTGQIRGEWGIESQFDAWLAAVEARGARRERERIATKVLAMAPYNCELRPDGSEDPAIAAWVESIRDVYQAITEAPDE